MQRNVSDPFLEQVCRTLHTHDLVAAGDHVLVAISGGGDSIALLAALVALSKDLGIRVSAAHIDHGLRGAESQRDAEHAVHVATHLGVPCVVRAAHLAPGSPNLEEQARLLRYESLSIVAAECGAGRIATGHTRDDQAETVVMRMLRGCGLDGLGGIPIRRDSIVRPLLDCSRSAARAFLAEQDLTFCEDSSNADRRFLRNRVRHDILPRLAAAEPGVVERLARGAQRAREEASALDELLRAPLEQALDGDESLDAGAVLGLSRALRGRFLRLWLRLVRGHLRNLSAVHLDQLVALAQRDGGSSIVTLPGADRVYFEYGRLRFARGGRNLAFAPVRLGFEERLELPTGWVLQTTVTSTKDRTDTDRRNLHMVADADKLRGAIVVRSPCAGDRLQPLGMTGRKKLQDILVDRKIASRLRPTLPVLEVGGEILWVAGVVRSGHALLSEATKHTLNVVAEQVGIAGA